MQNLYNISAKITGVRYTPHLCKELPTVEIANFEQALAKKSTFVLKIDDDQQLAVSWWVSAKRTRTYPYVRVYDSLLFSGKKVTVIPIVKDEGADGERDFLQFDTVSLMSLLGVYVIIGYYIDAEQSPRYTNKITKQRYDTNHIIEEILKIPSYHSDALHWNLAQIERAGEIGEKAIQSYARISRKLGVNMHSIELAKERIAQLQEGRETFLNLSRKLAQKAQKTESITIQPKESLEGEKSIITIENYLGGKYYLTCDEAEIHDNEIFLIEGKHTTGKRLPTLNDIKDGLLRMILLTNLQDVRVDDRRFRAVPILKLTTGHPVDIDSLSYRQREELDLLKKESEKNGFRVLINSQFLDEK